jgi:hypothetical protein
MRTKNREQKLLPRLCAVVSLNVMDGRFLSGCEQPG